MRLETSGDNPFTTSAVYEAWSGISIIQFGRNAPANSKDAEKWAHHALETEVGNWHVFRIYAGHGPTLGRNFRHGSQYDDSNPDCIVCSRTVDGAWELISHRHGPEFKLKTSINLEKPNTKERSSNNSRQ